MNNEQQKWIDQLKPLVDSLSLMVMPKVPELFKEHIGPTSTGKGKIINVSITWSFQSDSDDTPVKEVIRSIEVGNVGSVKYVVTRPEVWNDQGVIE